MNESITSGNILRKFSDISCKMCVYQSIEIEKLQKENELLKKCVKFYASNGSIEESTEWFPGQKARECLKELNEDYEND